MQIKSRGIWLLLPTLWIPSFIFAQQPKEFQLTATEFSFKPARLQVPQGQVKIVVSNRGEFPHALAIVGREEKISYIEPGETKSLVVKFDEAGELIIYCSQPGHRSEGMEGTLSVGKK